MSVFQRFDGVWHFRYAYKGQVIRRSTKQGNKRIAEEMERADRSARAKGELGLGEKPLCPTLAQFLLQRVQPWAANEKDTTKRWYKSGINPILQYDALAQRQMDTITSETVAD